MNQSIIQKYRAPIVILVSFLLALLCASPVTSAQPGEYKKFKKDSVYRAPIHHYYAVGHRISHLPTGFVSLKFGGRNYYYHSGVYYRPYKSHYTVVNAPLGLSIRDLPYGYRELRLVDRTYYAANGTYYSYDNRNKRYVVVKEPVSITSAATSPFTVSSTELFVYPKENQTVEQTARDRYECYLWSTNETGFDPGNIYEDDGVESAEEYRRASGACLEARGYTVK